MKNELKNNADNEKDKLEAEVLKKWHSPQMTTVSISDLTRGISGPQSELNTTTKS